MNGLKLLKQLYCWIPVFLIFISTAAIALTYRTPIAVDVHFHLEIAKAWARGENGMFCEIVMRINRMPYPPLLHWLMIPALLNPAIILSFMQMWLLPLATFSLMFLMWKIYGKNYALFAGLLALGSYAFVDRLLMVSPQALNMILLPIVFLSFIRRQEKTFALSSAAMIYTHGVVGLACLGGSWLLALKQRRWKPVALAILLSLPILLPTAPYLFIGWNRMAVGCENDQERGFYANPLTFPPRYYRLVILGFPAALYLLYRKVRRKEELSDLQKISLLSLASMLIMVIPWVDRFMQHSTIPLVVLMTPLLVRSKRSVILFYIVVFFFLFMYSALIIWLLTDHYYIHKTF